MDHVPRSAVAPVSGPGICTSECHHDRGGSAGNRVARYRFADQPGRKWSSDSVEIIVHPRQKLTDELALVLAISAGWLEEYFDGMSAG